MSTSPSHQRRTAMICVHELIDAQAAKTPDAIAVEYEDERIAYGDLNTQANRLAHHLRALGVGPEVLVGLCAERSIELIVGLLGILKAGGAYVPVDPSYPADRMATMLADAGVSVLLTQSHIEKRLPKIDLTLVRLDADGLLWSNQPATSPINGITPNNSIYVVYTSGSTGRPKGVVVEHCNVAAFLSAATSGGRYAAPCKVLHRASIAFDVSVLELIGPLIAGGCVVMAPRDAGAAPPILAALIRHRGVTAVDFPPALLRYMIDEPDFVEAESLRMVVVGGETLEPDIVSKFFAKCRAELWNEYGPTEATVSATSWPAALYHETGAIRIGRALPGYRVYVVDERGENAPIGFSGELCIGGVGVTRGYLGKPGQTAARFVPDPFSNEPGARLYRTGDLACWNADGNLGFLGRFDDQVKIRGFRIELGDIEAALAAQPSVRACVVLAREDIPGDKRLAAYVVPREGECTTSVLREYLQGKLPEYMIPAAFVMLDALPLTSNGKVDRKALPAPELTREGSGVSYEPPRNDTERALLDIWSEVLRVRDIGIFDNFFALGGDSIQAIQVVGRAKRVGFFLTQRDLFAHPTVADLARITRQVNAPVAEQGRVMGEIALTPIQAWYFEGEPVDAHHFNQAAIWTLSPVATPEFISLALSAVLTQHDVLRLRYRRAESGWVQAHADDATFPLEIVDLSAVEPSMLSSALISAADTIQAGLSLESGPVARAAWFNLPAAGSRLLVVLHHLIVDGVSWRLLHEDLESATGQLLAGQPITLGPKTTSFQQWSERLFQWVREGGLTKQLSYWQTMCSRGVVELPVDRDASLGTIGETKSVEVLLPEAETTALLREVSAAYRTEINDVLLSALAEALSVYCKANTVTIGLEGHGREELLDELDVSRTVGWFTSFFPIWLDVPADGDPGRLLKSVKEQLRAVPNRGFGYGWLRYAHPDEQVRASLAAFTNVVFNYLGQFDMEAQGYGLLLQATESTGSRISPRMAPREALAITGKVLKGSLRLSWVYCPAVHDRSTIEGLAQQFITSLRRLITHCTKAATFGYTPSDFPLAGLEQTALDELVGTERGIEAIYPLTPLQAGMLFHALRDPDLPTYTVQMAMQFGSDLDIATLGAAWKAMISRHAIYRTSFVWDRVATPLQVVHRDVSFEISQKDWSALSESDANARLESWLVEERHAGFDFSRAPLLRVMVVRMPGEKTWMVKTEHHILLDGWSGSVFQGELSVVYEALRAGRKPVMPDPTPYERYITWITQRDLSASDNFFRHYLAGVDEPTRLGLPRPQTTLPSRENVELRAELSAIETQALFAFAKRHRLTANTILQGALGLVLGRYAGRPDVVFGATTSGRSAPVPGIERMMGLFINTLPLRAKWSATDTVVSWLQALQSEQADVRAYEATPLWEVQRATGVGAGQDLFDTLLIIENFPEDETATNNKALPLLAWRNFEQTNYTLTVAAFFGKTLHLRLTWNPDVLRLEDVERFWGHLRTLMLDVMGYPDKRLSDLALLTEAELTQRSAWNDTAADAPSEKCIHELFEQQAAETPNAIAVVFENESLDYGELDARANRLAHHLRALGVGPEVPVGLCVERSLEMVVGLLGILKAGGAYVPLDPVYPPERLALMMADAQLPVILTQGRIRERLPAPETHVVQLDGEPLSWSTLSSLPVKSGVGSTNLAYVIYTSGSTGKPKGVAVEHHNASNLVFTMGRTIGIGPGRRVLQVASLNFDVSVMEIFMTLCHGGALHLAKPDELLDPALLKQKVQREAIDVASFPAAMLVTLAPRDFPSLSTVITGGEVLPRDVALSWVRHGRLLNQYGPTETTVCATLAQCSTALLPPVIGRPIANVEIHILDAHQKPVPVGVTGELCIGGAGVARGYLNRPELTAEKFIDNPFGKGRLYKTGDLVRQDVDGNIEFLGRTDHQVKIRGFRIELGEIEAALSAFTSVQSCAVIAREDAPGNKRLVAYVVSAAAHHDDKPLREFLRTRLPDYMIPSAFVFLDALPLTPNAKVDRKALPAPEESEATSKEYIAPTTPLERTVANVFAQVLHLDRIGLHDDFFTLGGHSLLAVQVVSRLRDALGVDVPVRLLFAAPTIAGLAQALDHGHVAAATETIPIVLRGPETRFPLSFAQERIWQLERRSDWTAVFNMGMALRLQGPLDRNGFAAALRDLVERHETLRTAVVHDDGQWYQTILPADRVSVVWEDLTHLDPKARQIEILECLASESEHRFQNPVCTFGAAGRLRRPSPQTPGEPLCRIRLLALGKDENALILTMHHSVADGWSMGVVMTELGQAYRSRIVGRAPTLEPLPLQMVDYATWERSRLSGEPLERLLGYWRHKLLDAPSLLLRTDHPRPNKLSDRGGIVPVKLSATLSGELEALAQANGTTLFIVLLATWQLLLCRYSGQDDIVVGTLIANRTRHDTEGIIGCFINLLALRTDMSGDPTFTDLLKRANVTATAAYEHQSAPIELVIDAVGVARDPSRRPLFQTMVVLQNAPAGSERLAEDIEHAPLDTGPDGVSRFELMISLTKTSTGLRGILRYATDLYEAATAEIISRDLIALFERIVARPNDALSSLASGTLWGDHAASVSSRLGASG